MPAQLVALDQTASILLDKPILLVGRHPECDIQIDSCKISRRHCCIAQVSDYLVIRDLGSTNGIRINGVRVNEGRLAPGDEVTIGSSRYQVAWESMAPGAAVAMAVPKVKSSPALPPQPARVADELLEECDEPVPLVEPEDGADVVLPIPKTPSPLPAALEPPAGPNVTARANESRILPDSFELAPRSDVAHPSDPGPAPAQ